MKALTRTIYNRYGSKRGMLHHHYYQCLLWAGWFRTMRRQGQGSIERLVMVCMGNICRSPLAEAVARAQGAEVESFGLNCSDDYPADPRAIAFAAEQGLSLDQHRTRHIRHYQPRPGDLLVGMEPQHSDQLRQLFPQTAVTLAGLWLPSPKPYLHDPFNTNPAFFQHCERQVVEGISRLLEEKLA